MLVICPYIWELRNQNRRLTRLSFLTCSSRIVLVLCSPIISISRFKATSELTAIPSSNTVSSMFMAFLLTRRMFRLLRDVPVPAPVLLQTSILYLPLCALLNGRIVILCLHYGSSVAILIKAGEIERISLDLDV